MIVYCMIGCSVCIVVECIVNDCFVVFVVVCCDCVIGIVVDCIVYYCVSVVI